MALNQSSLHNAYESSLLHKLTEEEINQIFIDHKLYGSISYTFFIDANDILSFIDPYSLIYRKDKIVDQKNLADNFYAANALFEHKRKKVFLFNEYVSELNIHRKRFTEISSLTSSLNELISKKELINTQETRIFIEKFFSEIFFILKRKNKSLASIYNDLFSTNKIKTNHDLEDSYFAEAEMFLEEEHRKRIELIYDLFPKQNKGYNSLIDSICIYKVFLLNQISTHNIKFIYFSSARKSKTVFGKISKQINNKDWKWLKQILEYNPEEDLFFYRNNKWNFGYIIYHTLSKKTLHSKKIFKDYCIKKSESSFISNVLNQKRESLENLAIFSDCKLTSDELKYSEKNSKNIEYLLNEIIDLNKSIKNRKIDLIKEVIFTTELAQELYSYLQTNELIIDRGKDNIISLFNTLPPLFALNSQLLNRNKYKRYQNKVQDLIFDASLKKGDRHRISSAKIFELLKDYSAETNSLKLDEINNLLIIFLLIFIQYKSKDGTDSNTLSYQYCETFLKQINKKINHLKIKESENQSTINDMEFVLREIAVLSVWSLRRKGDNLSDMNLKHSNRIHADYKVKYSDDYRFILSHFLYKLNFLYSYKEKHKQNLNEISQYVVELIRLGEDVKKSIIDITDYEKNNYILQTYKTLINSLSFIYCIRLDILLYQNRNNKEFSNKSIEIFEKIKRLKQKRKDLKSRIESDYEERILYHPVFPYVEAYIEYIESCMNPEKSSVKIGHALDSINIALNNVEIDKIHRPFFYKCCEFLKRCILRKKKNLTKPYSSFILNIDEIR